MADGTAKAISNVQVGDSVRATDPTTAAMYSRTVTAVHHDVDQELTDLALADADGNLSILHTTRNHPFWDETKHRWIDADSLDIGDALHTPDGATITVAALLSYAGPQSRYNLTTDTPHTYYVIAGSTSVLVHNCNPLTRAEKRKLGNLSGSADETAADMIKERGGGASQVNQLQSGYGQMTLRELAHLAVQGDSEAEKAIKMVKQAGSQGKGGK